MDFIGEIDEDTSDKVVLENGEAQELEPGITQQSDCSIVTEESPDIDHLEVTPDVVPRKRGRPRKRPLNPDEAFAVANKKEKQPRETKSKRKADPPKPMFVGGVPVNPLQGGESAVKNPYNYDPLAELNELGGQLVSAYRNSKNNIALSKEKKIYRVDHKYSDDNENVPADASGDHQMIPDVQKKPENP